MYTKNEDPYKAVSQSRVLAENYSRELSNKPILFLGQSVVRCDRTNGLKFQSEILPTYLSHSMHITVLPAYN